MVRLLAAVVIGALIQACSASPSSDHEAPRRVEPDTEPSIDLADRGFILRKAQFQRKVEGVAPDQATLEDQIFILDTGMIMHLNPDCPELAKKGDIQDAVAQAWGRSRPPLRGKPLQILGVYLRKGRIVDHRPIDGVDQSKTLFYEEATFCHRCCW